ncbi:MAG: DUF6171 family protein [Firmicutes bacterium]|nr:DUF6171 family protein [Bacillota bacterium]
MQRVCRICLRKDLDQQRKESLYRALAALEPSARSEEEIRENRLEKCLKCKSLSAGTCMSCGRLVEYMASVAAQGCPEDRW